MHRVYAITETQWREYVLARNIMVIAVRKLAWRSEFNFQLRLFPFHLTLNALEIGIETIYSLPPTINPTLTPIRQGGQVLRVMSTLRGLGFFTIIGIFNWVCNVLHSHIRLFRRIYIYIYIQVITPVIYIYIYIYTEVITSSPREAPLVV